MAVLVVLDGKHRSLHGLIPLTREVWARESQKPGFLVTVANMARQCLQRDLTDSDLWTKMVENAQ